MGAVDVGQLATDLRRRDAKHLFSEVHISAALIDGQIIAPVALRQNYPLMFQCCLEGLAAIAAVVTSPDSLANFVNVNPKPPRLFVFVARRRVIEFCSPAHS